MDELQKNLESTSEFHLKSDLEINRAHNLKEKEIDINAGFLGKFFGSGENAPVNTASFLIIVALLAGIITSALNTETYAKDFWVIVSPLITLSLGYLFGHKNT